jgi:hypothetical protein
MFVELQRWKAIKFEGKFVLIWLLNELRSVVLRANLSGNDARHERK